MNKLWTGQKWFWKFLFSEFSDKYLQKRSGKCFVSAASRRVLWKWREARMGIDTSLLPPWPFCHKKWKWREVRMGIDTQNVGIAIFFDPLWKWREARMGIDTCNFIFHSISKFHGRNEEKPEWALTLCSSLRNFFDNISGNEEKPERALTHFLDFFCCLFSSHVEMKRSPNGYWHKYPYWISSIFVDVEMKRSPKWK